MHFIIGMGRHDFKNDVMPRVSKAIASLAVDHQQLRSIMTQGSFSSSMVSGRRPVTVVKCCCRCGNRCEILSAKKHHREVSYLLNLCTVFLTNETINQNTWICLLRRALLQDVSLVCPKTSELLRFFPFSLQMYEPEAAGESAHPATVDS